MTEALDRSMLADPTEKLVSTIDCASGIKRGIRSARRGLDNAEAAYMRMTEEAMAVLYDLEDPCS